MSKSKPTIPLTEILAQLNKPAKMRHQSCFVFVEGDEDVIIYREILRKKGLETFFTFDQRGGRNSLFQAHSEIAKNPQLSSQVLFFADQDTYVFQDIIPAQYSAINFTKGYSIENDLFQDGSTFLLKELSPTEQSRFETLIRNIANWFAFEVSLLLNDRERDTKISISGLDENVIAPNSNDLTSAFKQKRNYQTSDHELFDKIQKNYDLLLRGKILFEVLLRIAFDRGGVHFKSRDAYWNICITEGLRLGLSSNIHRILTIFETKIR
jgi:Protein of unknown function (DUF4435)